MKVLKLKLIWRFSTTEVKYGALEKYAPQFHRNPYEFLNVLTKFARHCFL